MKTIKDLTVDVTYTVGYGGMVVSDEVYKGLQKIQDEHHGKASSDICCDNKDADLAAAFEWLADNIKEVDAYEWSYELLDFE